MELRRQVRKQFEDNESEEYIQTEEEKEAQKDIDSTIERLKTGEIKL